MKLYLLVTLTLFLLPVTFPQAAELSEKVRCGSYCLTVGLNSLGVGTDLKSIESKLGEPDARGYSFLQLKEAANRFGLKTLLAETSIEQLLYRKNKLGESFVCISHLKKEHYVVLYDVTENLVKFCDPPELRQLDIPVFNKVWDGNVLLISRKDLKSENDVASDRRLLAIFKRAMVALIIILFLVVVLYFARKLVECRGNRLPHVFTGVAILVLVYSGYSDSNGLHMLS